MPKKKYRNPKEFYENLIALEDKKTLILENGKNYLSNIRREKLWQVKELGRIEFPQMTYEDGFCTNRSELNSSWRKKAEEVIGNV